MNPEHTDREINNIFEQMLLIGYRINDEFCFHFRNYFSAGSDQFQRCHLNFDFSKRMTTTFIIGIGTYFMFYCE